MMNINELAEDLERAGYTVLSPADSELVSSALLYYANGVAYVEGGPLAKEADNLRRRRRKGRASILAQNIPVKGHYTIDTDGTGSSVKYERD